MDGQKVDGDDLPPKKYSGDLAEEPVNESAEEAAMAHSPVHASEGLREVLLGEMPPHQQK